jgi:cysteine-rich repeat protein
VCDADCTTAACGDGVLNQAAGEECDDGGESAVCDSDCTAAFCGDATWNVTAGEECDDGGESAACDADCTAAECGDGTLNPTAGEECDDGNTIDGDGCSSACLNEGQPLPDCTILFEPGQCPDTMEVCGAVFLGGDGCVSAGPCASTPPFAYRLMPGPPLMIELNGELNVLEVFFSGQAGSYGEMHFFDADGLEVDASLPTNGDCQFGPPPPEIVAFSRPVRTIQVMAMGGPVWIDTFRVNPGP